MQGDVRTDGILLCFGNRITVRTCRLPLECLLCAVGTADNLDLVRDHKCGVKADAELPDNVYIVRVGFIFLGKLQRTAFGNGAEIFVEFRLGHADAVVGNFQETVVFVN